MRTAAWAILGVSLAALLLVIFRNRYSHQWLVKAGLHAVAAAGALYLLNWAGAPYSFHLPLNMSTVATVGILGIPGVLLLAGIQWIVS